MIKIFDNVISEEVQSQIHKEILSLSYVPEQDSPKTPACGYSSGLELNSLTFQTLNNILQNIPELRGTELYKVMVNKFLPNEVPYFHTDHIDGIGYTALYYSNDNQFNLEELGETLFYLKEPDEIRGILPKPGRLVIFNADILHRATSFRNIDRYTVAFKFR